jgi:hypothetical protein
VAGALKRLQGFFAALRVTFYSIAPFWEFEPFAGSDVHFPEMKSWVEVQ